MFSIYLVLLAMFNYFFIYFNTILMCNDMLFGSQCHHKVWLCFVVFIVHIEYIYLYSIGTLCMYGGR